MQKPWFHPLISLISAIGLLVFSIKLDDFLKLQKRIATSSFDYGPSLLAEIVAGLLMFIAWTALGWYVLFSHRPGRGVSIALLVLGAFVIWAPYIGMWAGLHFVLLRLNLLMPDLVRLSALFIAVLGGLGFLYKLR